MANQNDYSGGISGRLIGRHAFRNNPDAMLKADADARRRTLRRDAERHGCEWPDQMQALLRMEDKPLLAIKRTDALGLMGCKPRKRKNWTGAYGNLNAALKAASGSKRRREYRQRAVAAWAHTHKEHGQAFPMIVTLTLAPECLEAIETRTTPTDAVRQFGNSVKARCKRMGIEVAWQRAAERGKKHGRLHWHWLMIFSDNPGLDRPKSTLDWHMTGLEGYWKYGIVNCEPVRTTRTDSWGSIGWPWPHKQRPGEPPQPVKEETPMKAMAYIAKYVSKDFLGPLDMHPPGMSRGLGLKDVREGMARCKTATLMDYICSADKLPIKIKGVSWTGHTLKEQARRELGLRNTPEEALGFAEEHKPRPSLFDDIEAARKDDEGRTTDGRQVLPEMGRQRVDKTQAAGELQGALEALTRWKEMMRGWVDKPLRQRLRMEMTGKAEELEAKYESKAEIAAMAKEELRKDGRLKPDMKEFLEDLIDRDARGEKTLINGEHLAMAAISQAHNKDPTDCKTILRLAGA